MAPLDYRGSQPASRVKVLGDGTLEDDVAGQSDGQTLCGILTPGALWEHERSVAVAAPAAVSSGVVHLVGSQSRHTAQKGQ